MGPFFSSCIFKVIKNNNNSREFYCQTFDKNLSKTDLMLSVRKFLKTCIALSSVSTERDVMLLVGCC